MYTTESSWKHNRELILNQVNVTFLEYKIHLVIGTFFVPIFHLRLFQVSV